MTTPILLKSTKFILSDEAHIRPVGHGFDDDYISLTQIDISRRGSSGACQNSLYTLYIGLRRRWLLKTPGRGLTVDKKPPTRDGLIRFLLRRRGESGLS